MSGTKYQATISWVEKANLLKFAIAYRMLQPKIVTNMHVFMYESVLFSQFFRIKSEFVSQACW